MATMSYSVYRVDPRENKGAILSALLRNFPETPERRFSWIYEGNPYGSPACWVLKESTENKVVGSAVLFPRRLFVEGQPRLAGLAGDFVMDREHRALGPALALQKEAVASNSTAEFDFLYGFPNEQAEKVLCRAGYRVVGTLLRIVKPLRCEYYLSRSLSTGLSMRALSKITDLSMRLAFKEIYHKTPRKYGFESLTRFDHRFDDLWARVRGRYKIIGERTSAFLNWKYERSPYRESTLSALTHKRTGEVLGYIVSYPEKGHTWIADLLALDEDGIFDSLLSEFLRWQYSQGSYSVTALYLGHPFLIKKLRSFGFFARKYQRTLTVCAKRGSNVAPCLLDANNWYVFSGDGDV